MHLFLASFLPAFLFCIGIFFFLPLLALLIGVDRVVVCVLSYTAN